MNKNRLFYLTIVFVTLFPFLFAAIYEKQREEDFVFVFLNAALLIFPLRFFKRKNLYVGSVFGLLLVPALMELAHVYLYQGRITPSTFFIVFDSNPAESLEFFQSNFAWPLVALLVLYATICFSLLRMTFKAAAAPPRFTLPKYFGIWILLPFLIKFGGARGDIEKTLEAYQRSSSISTMGVAYIDYQEQMETFRSFASTQQTDFQIDRDERSEQETYILVIGESTTRQKMSLYGYHRDTTPNLVDRRDELFVFENVLSSSSGTLANLRRIITLANQENESPQALRSNLVNIMKAAGFTTFWLSNQLSLSEHDTITTVFAKQSDHFIFTNTTSSGTSTIHDEVVFPIAQRYAGHEAKKKFIVIHLMGTHMVYRNRYPTEFERFTDYSDIPDRPFLNDRKRDYINQYDNAIYYHDHVVSEILDIFKERDEYTALLYLSDHGEEVYDTKDLHGHPGNNPTRAIYEIPFFVWASPKYLQEKRALFARPGILTDQYVSDDVIHTLFDLFGVYPSSYEPHRNVFSPEYVEKAWDIME